MSASFAIGYRRNPWVGGLSAAGAFGVCTLLLLLLLSGLAVDAWRRAAPTETQVTLVPLPPPEPPKPVPPPPQPAKLLNRPSVRPGAPAPLQASPIEQPDQTIVPLAPPAPPAATSDGHGGPGVGPGTGTGTGGTGSGGNGTVARKVRLVPASWARRPSPAELRSHYPDLAKALKLDGEVLLACAVQPDKRVTGCRVLRESPRDLGFADAALAASNSFRLNPPKRNEADDIDTRVVIPVNFGR